MRKLIWGIFLLPFYLSAQVVNPPSSLPAGTTAVTQPIYDSSSKVATTQFVGQQAQAGRSTIPFAGITGGTFSFASIGSGAVVVANASAGAITGILTYATPGTGYVVGDVLSIPSGNYDNFLRVTSVSSGGITGLSVIYGGTGNSPVTSGLLGAQTTYPRNFEWSGALTSPIVLVIPNGTYISSSTQFTVANNTTGAQAFSVYLSNGSDAPTGTPVVLQQGTANSNPYFLWTDGVNGIYPVAKTPYTGIATLSSGTITVSNAAACTPSATCTYKLTNCGINGSSAIGTPSVGTVVAGTSFVINSYTAIAGIAVDSSIICWQIN